MNRLCFAVPFLLAFAAISSAQAQQNELEAARTLASNYQLSDANGERKCAVTLEAKTSAPGFALIFDRAECLPLFGYLADTAAWKPAPGNGIYLINAKGVLIAEFTEGVGGVYEALRERDGVYFLTNLRVADNAALQPSDLAGEWNLSRPNGPVLCRITLTLEAAAEQRLKLAVAPKCDNAITSFGPVAWQINNGDVLLFSEKGEQIRLGRNDEGVWMRMPDRNQAKPRPLQMTRP